MSDTTADRAPLNATAQNLLRIVIASYFLAVALNLIPGTSLTILAAQVLPLHIAQPLSAILVFALAFMVMIGLYMRPAALVLGVMTFFASYLRTIELGVDDELGTFWRDLVLIAALMLTYAENAPRDQRMRRAIERKVMPRRVSQPQSHRPRPVIAAAQNPVPAPHRVPVKPRTAAFVLRHVSRAASGNDTPEPIDNIFADALPAH